MNRRHELSEKAKRFQLIMTYIALGIAGFILGSLSLFLSILALLKVYKIT